MLPSLSPLLSLTKERSAMSYAYRRGTYNQPRWRLSTDLPYHICEVEKWFLDGTLLRFLAPGTPMHETDDRSALPVLGIGSVNVYIEDPTDGSCQRIELHNVYYIPDYNDSGCPQIHQLIIARNNWTISPDVDELDRRVCSFTDDSGRPIHCFIWANMVIETCRHPACNRARRHCG